MYTVHSTCICTAYIYMNIRIRTCTFPGDSRLRVVRREDADVTEPRQRQTTQTTGIHDTFSCICACHAAEISIP
jgi:hypothetical protein